ncbi:hypothetical protein DFP98_13979 [Cohnella phaseoli]|uniref:Uncharacterized protein n=1 Tax=Cohnella phaseoli TaxID=456490 RepID=A0A3D9I4B1_9BACL|nr:hypothetical protein DFP98_13979 [Cohnella phaseoli]
MASLIIDHHATLLTGQPQSLLTTNLINRIHSDVIEAGVNPTPS